MAVHWNERAVRSAEASYSTLGTVEAGGRAENARISE